MDEMTNKALRALRTVHATTRPGSPVRQAVDLAIKDLNRLSGQVDELVAARERTAMLLPVGEDIGQLEDDLERYIDSLRMKVGD